MSNQGLYKQKRMDFVTVYAVAFTFSKKHGVEFSDDDLMKIGSFVAEAFRASDKRMRKPVIVSQVENSPFVKNVNAYPAQFRHKIKEIIWQYSVLRKVFQIESLSMEFFPSNYDSFLKEISKFV